MTYDSSARDAGYRTVVNVLTARSLPPLRVICGHQEVMR
jgi:hypothetical protein